MRARIFALVVALGLVATSTANARDLSQLIGWTIIDVVTISRTEKSGRDIVLKLTNGKALRLSMCLILPPLPLTDAVILANQAGGATMGKILIDDEVCDIAAPRSQ